MKLYPNMRDEYFKRHNPLKSEMEQMLKEHGVTNYSIFLDSKSSTLFGYLECTSEELLTKIPQTDACQKWWSYMSDIMETNDDHSPLVEDLDHVFDLGKDLS